MTEATKTETDARLEKIQKLLTKAERTSNEHEAAAFFAKAEELMTRWAIDDAMLQAAGKKPEDKIEQRRVKIASTYFNPDISLLHGICRSHNCKLLQNKQGKYGLVIGFTSDVDHVITLYTSLQMQAARFSRLASKEEPMFDRMASMDQYIWRRSFREGFAVRVSERLKDAVKATHAEAKKTHGTGMELVLVNRKDKVDEYYDGLSKGKARASNSRYNFGAGNAGRKAGDRADIGNKRVAGRKAIG